MKQNQSQQERLTFGFLTEHGSSDNQTLMMTGVFDAARKHDVNVIRFAVRSLDYKDNDELTKIYDLIQLYKLNGLLFLGWMPAIRKNINEFKQKLKSIPLISLGAKYDGIPGMYMDGSVYIREMLLHLINVHGYKKIVFVPPSWPDGREEVYEKTMKEYGLYQPDLMIPRDVLSKEVFSNRSRRVVSLLFDEHKLAVDAIMTTYYVDAHLLLEELGKRGINVPEDLALTSYEDCDAARYNLPPITTIYYPFRELGFYGLEKLLDLVQHKQNDFSGIVPSKIIIRNSCGCMANSVSLAKTGSVKAAAHTLENITQTEQQELIARLEYNFPILTSQGFDVEKLLTALIYDYKARTDSFLSNLQEQMHKSTLNYSLIEGFDEALYYFRQLVLPYLVKQEKDVLWEKEIFFQAQAIVKESIINSFGRRELQHRQQSYELQETGQELMTTFNISKLVGCLEASLQKVAITSCYVFLFYKGKSWNECRLILHYCDGKRLITDVELSNVTRYLVTNILRRNTRITLLTELLNVQNEYFGFVIYEPGPMDERIYSLLSVELSTALEGALILDKLVNTRQELIENAHRSGMAEIASGTLHNVGNVLNSVNTSMQLLLELSDKFRVEEYEKACELLERNLSNIEYFISNDPKGKKLLQFFLVLKDSFRNTQEQNLYHLKRLRDKVNLIGDIIAAQQSYAVTRVSTEELDLAEILDDALKIQSTSLEKSHITVVKNYPPNQIVYGQRAKLLQILINLFNNARDSMENTPPEEKKLTLTISADKVALYLRVTDKGCGIPKDLIQTVFNLGFTTKKNGHGFGLHSCANYMTEMGGRIWVESEGPGKGASFILQFSRLRQNMMLS